MKGARFANMAAIQESVTVVLRLIPKEAFAYSFQKLYEHCQQCVVKDGGYLEANKANLFVSSVLFVFCYHTLNFLDTPHMHGFKSKSTYFPIILYNPLKNQNSGYY
jgi:hypothetical protein